MPSIDDAHLGPVGPIGDDLTFFPAGVDIELVFA